MLNKVDDNIYEVPIGYRPGMRVPGRVFVSPQLLEMVEPGTVDQIANVATLSGIVKYSMAMPDAQFVITSQKGRRQPARTRLHSRDLEAARAKQTPAGKSTQHWQAFWQVAAKIFGIRIQTIGKNKHMVCRTLLIAEKL